VSATHIAEWVLSGGLLAGIGYAFVRSVVSSGLRGRLRLVALRRAPLGRRAATEAALDDPAFAPERIEASVSAILPRLLGDRGRLSGRPRVDILSVINREGQDEDRVVVRVRAHVDRGPAVPLAMRHGVIDARWTLVHDGTHWRLATDSGDPLDPSLLSSTLIASPGDDVERLREASLQELTDHPRRGGPGPGELVDADAPPPQQLKDLAVADERFEPMLIAAAVTHIVEAWEQSSSGSDAPLLAVATGAGAHALTFPRAGTGRRRVRDARAERWEVTRLDAAAVPPVVDVRVRVRAATGIDSDGHVRHLDLVWTLALDETTHGRPPRWCLTDSADHP
jgi:hypothetical protein